MDPSFEPAPGLVDKAGAYFQENLTQVLVIVGVLMVVGIVLALLRRVFGTTWV